MLGSLRLWLLQPLKMLRIVGELGPQVGDMGAVILIHLSLAFLALVILGHELRLECNTMCVSGFSGLVQMASSCLSSPSSPLCLYPASST